MEHDTQLRIGASVIIDTPTNRGVYGWISGIETLNTDRFYRVSFNIGGEHVTALFNRDELKPIEDDVAGGEEELSFGY